MPVRFCLCCIVCKQVAMSRAQGSLQREPVNHSWSVTRHRAQAVRQLATPEITSVLRLTERERERERKLKCLVVSDGRKVASDYHRSCVVSSVSNSKPGPPCLVCLLVTDALSGLLIGRPWPQCLLCSKFNFLLVCIKVLTMGPEINWLQTRQ